MHRQETTLEEAFLALTKGGSRQHAGRKADEEKDMIQDKENDIRPETSEAEPESEEIIEGQPQEAELEEEVSTEDMSEREEE
jgi:hypothetical protein